MILLHGYSASGLVQDIYFGLSKIVDAPDSYTGAWVIGPAAKSPGYYCPVVVGRTSGISRLCD